MDRLPAAQTYGLDRSPSASSVNAGAGNDKDEEEAAPLDVQCVCGGGKDGVMIVCGVCDTWQHGICYGVFPDQRHRLRGHVCLRCVKETGRKKDAEKKITCFDPSMEKMKPEVLRK